MSSFHNSHQVNNQAGHQNVYGGIHHYHHLDDTARVKRPRLGHHDSGSIESLDDNILDSLAFPEMHLRRGAISEPHQKTCQWLYDLEEYKTWKFQRSGLLWVKGKPGAGKSTLMAHIYHQTVCQGRSDNLTIDVAFFFTARGVPLQRTPLGMLRSILNQIFSRDVDNRSNLRRAYQEKQASFGNDHRVWEWQQPELEKLLAEAVLALGQQKSLAIFIDALDEAGEQAARKMARYFHNINDRAIQQMAMVKICISCRHYPVVPKFRALEIQVEKHNYGDIETYITNHLDIRNLSDNDTYDCIEWENLIRSLVETARGVFQWVHVVMPLIEEFVLEGRSPKYIQHRLKTVPKELGQIYESILERLISKSDRAQTRRLFQWVCLATRPLSVTEMRYALASHKALDQSPSVDCDDADDIIDTDEVMRSYIQSWSGGLIEIMPAAQGGDALVQPIHQSVNDFYLTKGLELLTQLDLRRRDIAIVSAIDDSVSDIVANCHGELYWCCLNYMSDNAMSFVSIPFSWSDWWRQTEAKSKMRATFPFLEYAGLNCLIHAKKARGHRGQDLSAEVHLINRCVPILEHVHKIHEPRTFWNAATTPLHVAAAADIIDLARYLLEHNIDVDVNDYHGWTALHMAAEQGHLAMVMMLIDNDASVQKRTVDGFTPLFLAARRGHADLFLLLRKVIRFDPSADVSETTLYAAASCGNVAMTKLCIEAGADINATGDWHSTALQVASHGGYTEVVRILLAAGADVNAVAIGSYSTALQEASQRGHKEVVEMLLAAGADANAPQGNYCGTALQIAAQEGYTEVLQMLLTAGADVNALEKDYHDTALQMAARGGYKEVVQVLVTAGADVNLVGNQYGTPLQEASYGGHTEVVQILLAARADINATGRWYGTALQEASFRGHKEVMRILLNAGADVNAAGGGRHGTALQVAAQEGHTELVQILLTAGADANAPEGIWSATALRGASLGGHKEVVQTLLASGAYANASGESFSGALQAASERGHEEIVEMLLNAGARY